LFRHFFRSLSIQFGVENKNASHNIARLAEKAKGFFIFLIKKA
jgi:hypothetical protein